MNTNRSKIYYNVQSKFDFRNHLIGTYINNNNLQGKNIVPVQEGEKIILRGRERSGSIMEKYLNSQEKSKKTSIKNDKDEDKDNQNKNKENNNNGM